MLKDTLRKAVQWDRQRKAKKYAAELCEDPSPRLRAIGEALAEHLGDSFSTEERRRIEAIERRRAELLASTREIPVVDFGAGDPAAKRTAEEMERGVHSQVRVATVCGWSKPAFWAASLFKMVRKLGPTSCVELGSCVGISAAYQAAALEMNGKGRLTTLEGSPEIAKLAEETLASQGLKNASVVCGSFTHTFEGVLQSSRPIDFLFNDGHHDHDAVLRYLEQSAPYLASEAVVIVDDISWSPGMRKAWTTIENDRRVVATVDLRTIGIALFGQAEGPRKTLQIPL